MTNLHNIENLNINGVNVDYVATNYNAYALEKDTALATQKTLEEGVIYHKKQEEANCNFEYNKQHETNIIYDSCDIVSTETNDQEFVTKTYNSSIEIHDNNFYYTSDSLKDVTTSEVYLSNNLTTEDNKKLTYNKDFDNNTIIKYNSKKYNKRLVSYRSKVANQSYLNTPTTLTLTIPGLTDNVYVFEPGFFMLTNTYYLGIEYSTNKDKILTSDVLFKNPDCTEVINPETELSPDTTDPYLIRANLPYDNFVYIPSDKRVFYKPNSTIDDIYALKLYLLNGTEVACGEFINTTKTKCLYEIYDYNTLDYEFTPILTSDSSAGTGYYKMSLPTDPNYVYGFMINDKFTTTSYGTFNTPYYYNSISNEEKIISLLFNSDAKDKIMKYFYKDKNCTINFTNSDIPNLSNSPTIFYINYTNTTDIYYKPSEIEPLEYLSGLLLDTNSQNISYFYTKQFKIYALHNLLSTTIPDTVNKIIVSDKITDLEIYSPSITPSEVYNLINSPYNAWTGMYSEKWLAIFRLNIETEPNKVYKFPAGFFNVYVSVDTLNVYRNIVFSTGTKSGSWLDPLNTLLFKDPECTQPLSTTDTDYLHLRTETTGIADCYYYIDTNKDVYFKNVNGTVTRPDDEVTTYTTTTCINGYVDLVNSDITYNGIEHLGPNRKKIYELQPKSLIYKEMTLTLIDDPDVYVPSGSTDKFYKIRLPTDKYVYRFMDHEHYGASNFLMPSVKQASPKSGEGTYCEHSYYLLFTTDAKNVFLNTFYTNRLCSKEYRLKESDFTGAVVDTVQLWYIQNNTINGLYYKYDKNTSYDYLPGLKIDRNGIVFKDYYTTYYNYYRIIEPNYKTTPTTLVYPKINLSINNIVLPKTTIYTEGTYLEHGLGKNVVVKQDCEEIHLLSKFFDDNDIDTAVEGQFGSFENFTGTIYVQERGLYSQFKDDELQVKFCEILKNNNVILCEDYITIY